MTTTSATGPDEVDATTERHPVLPAASVGAVVATLVNAGLWVGGRAADVSFEVPGSLVPEVGLGEVVLTTLLMFAVGAGLLARALRRSRQWVRGLVVVAALLAVASAGAPLSAAGDTASGVLLAAMHLVAGGVFVATAALVASRR